MCIICLTGFAVEENTEILVSNALFSHVSFKKLYHTGGGIIVQNM